MTWLNSSKLVTTTVVGAFGLSAIALLGVPKPAIAANILAGSDYWYTGDGTQFDFGNGIGIVQFQGIPILPGGTDTKVARIENCDFAVGCNDIALVMESLNLMSVAPVNLGGDLYNISVMIDPDRVSTGSMSISHEFADDNTAAPEGTFDSVLNVAFKALFAPILPGNGQSFEIRDSLRLTTKNAAWSHDPLSGTAIVEGDVGDLNANLHRPPLPNGFRDFSVVGSFRGQKFISNFVRERHPGKGQHNTCTRQPCPPDPGEPMSVPESSTVLVSIGMLGAMWVVRKNRQASN